MTRGTKEEGWVKTTTVSLVQIALVDTTAEDVVKSVATRTQDGCCGREGSRACFVRSSQCQRLHAVGDGGVSIIVVFHVLVVPHNP